MTGQQLVNAAMLDANILASGETPSTDESNDVFLKLNELLASWSSADLDVFATVKAVFNLTANTGSYTIGPAATFNTTRPQAITQANCITGNGGLYFPIQILSAQDFSKIIERNSTQQIIKALWYDNQYPTGTIYIAPLPSGATSIELFMWQQLAQLANLAATFDMPPGYERAVRLNLAVEICPMFGKPPDQLLLDRAMAALGTIRALNAPPSPGIAQLIQASGAATPVPPDVNAAITR